jgi:hypothetical protein
VQILTKWWIYFAGAALLIGFQLIRHLRKVLGTRAAKRDGPLSSGTLEGDIYSFRNGIFRLRRPEGTVAIQDGPSGVLFSDIAGGFTMVECHEIPRAHRDFLDVMGPKRFVETFIQEVLIPQRLSPVFGMPLLRDGYSPLGRGPGTYYVDGTVRGGSTFARFTPDGASDQLDLRIGLLATLRGERIFVFARGITPDLVSVGSDDFDEIEIYLLGILDSTHFATDYAGVTA